MTREICPSVLTLVPALPGLVACLSFHEGQMPGAAEGAGLEATAGTWGRFGDKAEPEAGAPRAGVLLRGDLTIAAQHAPRRRHAAAHDTTKEQGT